MKSPEMELKKDHKEVEENVRRLEMMVDKGKELREKDTGVNHTIPKAC